MLVSFVVVILTGCGGGSTAPPTEESPPLDSFQPASATDVVYGSAATQSGQVDLLLDIYQPEETCSALRPFVVFIHGGSFKSGSRNTVPLPDIARALTARGYAAISIGYRMMPDKPVVSAEFQQLHDDLVSSNTTQGRSIQSLKELEAAVAAFEDTITALRWANANATDHCLDLSHFALWGISTGGHVAHHVTYGLDDYNIDRPEPTVTIEYWGGMFSPDLIDTGEAPLFMVHGRTDPFVSYKSALARQSNATAVGVPLSFYTIEKGGHGFAMIDPEHVSVEGKSIYEATFDFIHAHLSDATAPLYKTQATSYEANEGVVFSQNFDQMESVVVNSAILGALFNEPSFSVGVEQGRVSIVDDGDSGKVLRVKFPANSVGPEGNGAQWGIVLPATFEELHVAYRIRFHEDFDFVRGGKLPGLVGGDANTGGNKPNGSDGWSARMMWRDNGRVTQYVYHPDQPEASGENMPWDDGNEGLRFFTPGVWHKVQHHIVMNTAGRFDGLIKGYLDGRLAFYRNNLRFRDVESFGIDTLYFSTFFGGSDDTWATTKDETIWFDDFKVSTVPIDR